MLPPAPVTFSTMIGWPRIARMPLAEEARQHVGRAACRERHDHGDRFRRIGLCLRAADPEQRRNDGSNQRTLHRQFLIALMPAALITGHHFSMSAFCCAPQRFGTSAARAAESPCRDRSGERSPPDRPAPPAVAVWSRLMIGAGVPAGAQKPYHSDMCTPGAPASSTVGISATLRIALGRRDRQRLDRAGPHVRRASSALDRPSD